MVQWYSVESAMRSGKDQATKVYVPQATNVMPYLVSHEPVLTYTLIKDPKAYQLSHYS